MACNPNGFPTYRCGNFPMVGDLIEFGTRSKRLLVSSIQEDSGPYKISCDGHQYEETALRLMTLIARHGTPEKERPHGR